MPLRNCCNFSVKIAIPLLSLAKYLVHKIVTSTYPYKFKVAISWQRNGNKTCVITSDMCGLHPRLIQERGIERILPIILRTRLCHVRDVLERARHATEGDVHHVASISVLDFSFHAIWQWRDKLFAIWEPELPSICKCHISLITSYNCERFQCHVFYFGVSLWEDLD